MATYKEVKGVTIQTKDDDPVLNVGTWATGGSMNTAREGSVGAGTTPAALVTMGTASGSNTAITETYNGTSWTEVNDLNTARRRGMSSGTQTAALAFGGDGPPSNLAVNESWNGSSWTEVNDLNTGALSAYGVGTSTASLCTGGARPSVSAANEQWDGSSWTEVGDLNTARSDLSGGGTTTAAFMSGGEPYTAKTETWNGSAWTEVNDLPTSNYGAWAMGTSTSGIYYGGEDRPPGNRVTTTLTWDGTSWSIAPNSLGTALYQVAGGVGGSSQDAIQFSGYNGSSGVANTEEWSFPPVTQDKLREGMIFVSGGLTLKAFGKAAGIPSATWASGGDMNQGRTTYKGSATNGTQTATMTAGGDTPALSPTVTALTELYNGTSWTEVNDLNVPTASMGGAGTQTAALNFGGLPPTGPGATNESWDGTSWTEVNDLNTARGNMASFGLQTAAISAGGRTPTKANVESWDGTSWTEVSDLNTARYDAAGVGTTPSGLVAGGDAAGDSTSGSNTVESWNGTSWTEIAEINTSRWGLSGGGVDDSNAIVFSGGNFPPGYKVLTEFWNGSSWTEVADMSVARALGSSSGSAATAVAMGGQGTSINQATTEEWTADAALSTVTVS